MKEKIFFYVFLFIVCMFIAGSIVEYINSGEENYLFMLLGAVIILIIGVVFLAPLVYKGKPPFSGKIGKPKTKFYEVRK